jgi:hypothetical protein
MKIHNPDPKNSKGKPTERFLFRYFVKSGILGILAALFSILPTNAAERVYLSFASANVSVSVKTRYFEDTVVLLPLPELSVIRSLSVIVTVIDSLLL